MGGDVVALRQAQTAAIFADLRKKASSIGYRILPPAQSSPGADDSRVITDLAPGGGQFIAEARGWTGRIVIFEKQKSLQLCPTARFNLITKRGGTIPQARLESLHFIALGDFRVYHDYARCQSKPPTRNEMISVAAATGAPVILGADDSRALPREMFLREWVRNGRHMIRAILIANELDAPKMWDLHVAELRKATGQLVDRLWKLFCVVDEAAIVRRDEQADKDPTISAAQITTGVGDGARTTTTLVTKASGKQVIEDMK